MKFKHFMILHFLGLLGRGTVTEDVLVQKASMITFLSMLRFMQMISSAVKTQSELGAQISF